MLSLEQVKQLDSKVSKMIDHARRIAGENAQLKERLNLNQKRIDELEVLVKQFKQEQSRIEDGILSALNRLNQFEDALENKLSTETKPSAENKLPAETQSPASARAIPPKKEEEKKTPGSDTESEPLVLEEQVESGELDIF